VHTAGIEPARLTPVGLKSTSLTSRTSMRKRKMRGGIWGVVSCIPYGFFLIGKSLSVKIAVGIQIMESSSWESNPDFRIQSPMYLPIILKEQKGSS
jgi:hypothetical protein